MTNRLLRVLFAAVVLGPAALPAAAQTSNTWKVGGLHGKAITADTVLLTIHSVEPIDGWRGGFVPSLALTCASGGVTSAFVVTGLPTMPEAGMDRHFSIFYHLDNGARTNEVWGQTSSSDTLVAPHPQAFAHSLLGAKRIRYAVTPDHSSRMILSFPLVGLDKAMARASAACGT